VKIHEILKQTIEQESKELKLQVVNGKAYAMLLDEMSGALLLNIHYPDVCRSE